jgi:hypothetical protein
LEELWGCDDKVTEKVIASTKFMLVREGHRWTCFILAQGFWSSWRLCRKMRYVITPF